MCMTCGCLDANNSHGDPRHLLLSQLEASAKADGKTPQDALHWAELTLQHSALKQKTDKSPKKAVVSPPPAPRLRAGAKKR
jgi:hypothetical protein